MTTSKVGGDYDVYTFMVLIQQTSNTVFGGDRRFYSMAEHLNKMYQYRSELEAAVQPMTPSGSDR